MPKVARMMQSGIDWCAYRGARLVLFLAVVGFGVWCGMILVSQVGVWLNTDQWVPFTTFDLLGLPTAAFENARVVEIVLKFIAATLVLSGLALLCFAAFTWASEAEYDTLEDMKERWRAEDQHSDRRGWG
jgi:hypothetical protein